MLETIIKIIYLLFSVYGIGVFCYNLLEGDDNEK